MMRDPHASHPISAPWAFLDSIKATPCVCGASSCSCPEYNSSSPLPRCSCPDPIQRASLIPRMETLLFFISEATCAHLPASNMVRTFHVPMVMVVLVEMMCFDLTASRWLSPPGVIHPTAGDTSSSRAKVTCVTFVSVFVTRRFLWDQVVSLTPNHQTWGTGDCS